MTYLHEYIYTLSCFHMQPRHVHMGAGENTIHIQYIHICIYVSETFTVSL